MPDQIYLFVVDGSKCIDGRDLGSWICNVPLSFGSANIIAF